MRLVAEAICIALAHSLWLLTAAAIVYALARRSLRAAGRHRLGVLLLTTTAVITLGLVVAGALGTSPADAVGNLSAGMAPDAPAATTPLLLDTSSPGAPTTGYAPTAIAALWLLGATLLLCRPLVGWWRLHRMRATRFAALTRAWQRRADRLATALGLSDVRFVASSQDDVPFTYGWLSVVVVVPVAMMTDLPADLAELLIAHELAHVRRRDYLAQWLQRIAEAVLFFHPLAWWLSHQITLERELACDADVVARGCDPLRYARALTELEALRPDTATLALAATGSPQPGTLMHRIRTLLTPDTNPTLRGAAAAALLTLGVVGATTAIACSAADPIDAPSPSVVNGAIIDEASIDTTEAPDVTEELAIAWLPASVTQHAALLTRVADETGVSADVLALMVLIESFGNPDAVSPYGARGLMQLMPATARAVAERHGIALPTEPDALDEALGDPRLNVTLGAHHVADLQQDLDELRWIWASYNAGRPAVDAHRQDGTPLPDEAQRYVKLLAALHAERHAATSPAYDAWRQRARQR